MNEAEGWREETAYHEAGHVVALYAQGFDLGDASIAANMDSVGRVATPLPKALSERLDVLEYMGNDGEEFAMRQIVVAFSGVKAIEILTGRVSAINPDTEPELVGSDYWRLSIWLPMLGPPAGDRDIYNNTQDLYNPSSQAHTDEAQARTDRLLRENWNAVRSVAEALLEHGEMEAGAIRSVLEKAGCARDDAPIRRVFLEVEQDRLLEEDSEHIHRVLYMQNEGRPEHEIEAEISGLNQEYEEKVRRYLRNAQELETLRGKEDV